MLKDNKGQIRILHSANIPLQNESKIKIFSDKEIMSKYATSGLSQYEILEEIFQVERN